MPEVITKNSFKTDLNGKPISESTRRTLILMSTGGRIDIGKDAKPTPGKKEKGS